MKMLSGFKVVAAFDEIVDRAERTIVIVTPYFDPWPHLAQILLQKLDRKVPVDMLLRGGEDREKGATAAEHFVQRGARVQFLDRLHAKVYLSEQQALLTSMNLLKSSRDSWEAGTLFDATEDAASYQEIAALAGGLFQTNKPSGHVGRHEVARNVRGDRRVSLRAPAFETKPGERRRSLH